MCGHAATASARGVDEKNALQSSLTKTATEMPPKTTTRPKRRRSSPTRLRFPNLSEAPQELPPRACARGEKWVR